MKDVLKSQSLGGKIPSAEGSPKGKGIIEFYSGVKVKLQEGRD